MKLSARNTLPGKIRKIERGAVNAEGQKAYAVIKASSVMIGTD
jgi:molybdopterin-binding protein